MLQRCRRSDSFSLGTAGNYELSMMVFRSIGLYFFSRGIHVGEIVIECRGNDVGDNTSSDSFVWFIE